MTSGTGCAPAPAQGCRPGRGPGSPDGPTGPERPRRCCLVRQTHRADLLVRPSFRNAASGGSRPSVGTPDGPTAGGTRGNVHLAHVPAATSRIRACGARPGRSSGLQVLRGAQTTRFREPDARVSRSAVRWRTTCTPRRAGRRLGGPGVRAWLRRPNITRRSGFRLWPAVGARYEQDQRPTGREPMGAVQLRRSARASASRRTDSAVMGSSQTIACS